MEDVFAMICNSAKNLGIPLGSALVNEAIETARLAIYEGRDAETAASLGRSILIRATQPAVA